MYTCDNIQAASDIAQVEQFSPIGIYAAGGVERV
jgi:hypothetical protein